MQLKLHVLVSDKDVTLVSSGDSPPNRDQIADATEEAVRWIGATRLELRTVMVEIPLLEALPAVHAAPTTVEDVTSPEIREALLRAIKEYGSVAPEDAYWTLIRALTPGVYQVSKSPGMSGITRVGE